MNKDLMFSSKNQEWETPPDLFKMLDMEFNFTLDPCATNENKKCDKHYTLEEDGLTKDWGGETVFINPPYSETSKWVEKAYNEAIKGVTSVMLIPARTDVKYFHTYILPYSNINPESNDYSWAAGIIDGEGCVRINKTKASSNCNLLTNDSYSVRLFVKMTCKNTINKLKDTFKVGTIYEERRTIGKKLYKWECSANQAKTVIDKIYRYSVTKKDQLFKTREFLEIKNNLTQNEKELYFQTLKQMKKAEDRSNNFINIDVRFLKGRVKFLMGGIQQDAAPFPSMIVVFEKK